MNSSLLYSHQNRVYKWMRKMCGSSGFCFICFTGIFGFIFRILISNKSNKQALLIHARSIHLKESGIHEEIKSFLLPCSPGILISTQTAQELDTGSVTGCIMGTGRRTPPISCYYKYRMFLWKTIWKHQLYMISELFLLIKCIAALSAAACH